MAMATTAQLENFQKLRAQARSNIDLMGVYFETPDFKKFKERVFSILVEREESLKSGRDKVRGAALIGPPGIGKTRMVEQIAADFRSVAEAAGGLEFGSEIWSVTVPSRATVKETCELILGELGYPISSRRDEGYLVRLVVNKLQDRGIAALHLDEVQDSGRYVTSDSMRHFTGRFRNFMQSKQWPVCVIITGTSEAKTIINQDGALLRRTEPIEVLPMTFPNDGPLVRKSIKDLLAQTGLKDEGLLDENEFIKILMHASADRFGIAIEIFISATGIAQKYRSDTLCVEHFAENYYERMNCDDALNPFLSHDWRNINTTVAMDRHLEETRATRRKPRKR
ncbi:AAA family ATPase [Parasulfitobacter algicola]|uniref:ATP-binding protein n=1 Tax=Parasulfitobacter algicola TaxID=2614809 RepID=A0ABX2IK66_9RHOB|nr:TniB family NTP-binding protein [Sulfitobacter algicola]NSX53269.1 ATP-binding protein [Sulfitobacter algicola]